MCKVVDWDSDDLAECTGKAAFRFDHYGPKAKPHKEPMRFEYCEAHRREWQMEIERFTKAGIWLLGVGYWHEELGKWKLHHPSWGMW